MLNVLYVTEDIWAYTAAQYQRDFVEAFGKIVRLTFYGPGNAGYHESKSLSDIEEDCGIVFDLMFFGHAFLSDDVASKNIARFGVKRLLSSNISKVGILNKEYVNLERKLNFFSENEFTKVFSHHHDIENLGKSSKLKFHFVPFGADPDRFHYLDWENKIIDVFFSGILKNSNNDQASDFRKEIVGELVWLLGNIPILRKPHYASLTILVRTVNSSVIERAFSKLFNINRHMSDADYASKLGLSKVVVNTHSPLQIVSTRYFETIASGSIIFTPYNPAFEKIFNTKLWVEYANVKEFRRKIDEFFSEPEAYSELSKLAYNEFVEAHTWDERARSVMLAIGL